MAEGNPVPRQTLNLQVPKPFHGTPADWTKWRQRFARYATVSGLSLGSDREQESVFLYSMGDVADDILTTLGVDEEATNLNDIISAFNNHFDAHKNVIVEHAKFNQCVQNQGESVDSFIQDLYKLANECEFGALTEELIRDRIVVGVRDDTLCKELQAKANLTLDLATQIARQAEARAENQPIITGETVVSAVHRSKPHFQTTTGTHRALQSKPADQRNMNKCGYCGKEPHQKHKCPVRSAECAFCKKKGHYKAVCRKRLTQVREVDDHDTD